MSPQQWRPLRLCRAKREETDNFRPYSSRQKGNLSYSAALIGP